MYIEIYIIDKKITNQTQKCVKILGGGKRMFRIAICDDESHFRKRIREILIDYLNKKGIEIIEKKYCTG